VITVLDRDGVLVGTCAANIAAYVQASREIGLPFDEIALEESIHKGDSINEFWQSVWGAISVLQLNRLRETKAYFFVEYLPLIQINSLWRDKILDSPIDFYLATKASMESSRFIINELIPDFLDSHIYSTQDSKYASKVDVLEKISKINEIQPHELAFFDDSSQTISICADAGFNAKLTPHFCGD
jgi:hypothetical protein